MTEQVIEGQGTRVDDDETIEVPTPDAEGKVNGLVPYKTEIAAFSKTALLLAELTSRYKDRRYEVTTTEGMADALVARRQIRTVRVALEKFRKQEKADILERGRKIDSDAKALTALLESLEDPIDAQIKAEEKRKADEKAAREAAEKARVDGIRAKINDFQQAVIDNTGQPAAMIQLAIDVLRDTPFDKEVFQEFMVEADEAKTSAILQLTKMQGAAELLEAQQAEVKRQQEAVEAERQRQAAEAAEQRRKADELQERERALAEKEAAAKAPAMPEPPPAPEIQPPEPPLVVITTTDKISEVAPITERMLIESAPWWVDRNEHAIKGRDGMVLLNYDQIDEIADFIVDCVNRLYPE